jgi:plastocyanin
LKRIVSAAVAAALSITYLFASPALAADAHTWSVQMGSVAFGSTGPRASGNRFYPESVAIHQGDSVAFNVVGAHLLAVNRPPGPVFALFGPPSFAATLTSPSQSVNSSIIGDAGPVTFTLTFASTLPAGRYLVICGLHLGMKELVDVRPPGAELPKTDAENAVTAQREIAHDLATFDRIDATANRGNRDDEDQGPTVWAGAGNKRGSNLRFFPASITVHVGQTITFLKTHDPTEPHTVTFGPENPDPILQFVPSGGNTYDGTGTVNSGFLSTSKQFAFYQLAGTPLVQATSFKVTFTKAGTFSYICEIHDVVGMVGTVVVRP